MDREIGLFGLTVLALCAWLVLRHFKVFPPTAALVAGGGWWLGFFILGNVT